MSITHTAEAVAIWLDSQGAPTRMVWAGIRYRVTDTPTRLGPDPDLLLSPALTHLPVLAIGWRFQGTADDGGSHIFDVRAADARGTWELIRVID
ncbi:MAG TPA: hypothetical protein VIJ18_02045 [Microbacteriaceae bacterium]